MNVSNKNKYESRLKTLRQERSSWEGHWREISDYILPRKGVYDGIIPNDGSRKNNRIIDSTATRALRILAAGLQGGLTSPARPWFRLGLADRDMSKHKSVRDWISNVEAVMYRALARSNFYSCIHSLYTELAGFGTGILYCEPDVDQGIRFRTLTAGEYCLATDAQGRVDTVYREFKMTARQLEKRFGIDALPATVRTSLASNRDHWFDILHAVQPRDEFNPRKLDKQNMPFESVFILNGMGNEILSESGFMENPYMAPRWDTSAMDVYGRSPGMDVLSDVKMLMEMSKSQIQAVHLTLRPPMKVPSMYSRRLNLLPGGQNPVEQNQQDAIAPLYQVRPDLAGVSGKIQEVRSAIREGFYNDVFMMMAGSTRKVITASEVAERHEEKLIQLGPVIDRQHTELLDPLIDRVFGILTRAGKLPEPPSCLDGMDIRIDYISILAQAQKMVGTQSIQSLSEFVGRLAGANPEILDKVDMDRAVDEYAELIGVPTGIVRSGDEVEKFRTQRREMQLQQQKMQQGMAAASAGTSMIKDLSQAGFTRNEVAGFAGKAEQIMSSM
ncbi:portal protein [Desulfovibrio gilichinskyi]|uniref:Bacteriophage head to tail connecting protein n=1 Tax=Desulfovibrio gilichinskyi TaxID=1519643 RepID=A0A1X7C1P1_9BACT|nr:portal protein [Desulfovibrio gilichinskyi]SME88371.1 Bacteriophage head to tail connecting protein [Desulfovibrio gilichinskyi]